MSFINTCLRASAFLPEPSLGLLLCEKLIVEREDELLSMLLDVFSDHGLSLDPTGRCASR